MTPDIFSGSEKERTILIDETLRAIGGVTPRQGLEGRVAIHLAHARKATPAQGQQSGLAWLRLVAAGASGVIACAAIIAGSVHHSRASLPASPSGDIRLSIPGGGMGAASAAHLASQEVPSTGRPRTAQKAGEKVPPEGRALIAPDAKHKAGEAVPQQP